MNILVINAGSSSVKYQLIDSKSEQVLAKGQCERIGQDGSIMKHRKSGGEEIVIQQPMPTHKQAIALVLQALTHAEHGVVKNMSEIGAVGHRVVHAGIDFKCSVVIDQAVMDKMELTRELAPLHNPAHIMGIRACQEVMPNTPMTIVFDTAFHSTMPDYAYMYAIKYEDYEKFHVRKYGFHGTSHKFVSQEAANYLKKDIKKLKIVTCHLGNGSSVCAVKHGICVDTSMGFTPLEGMPMGTRCGNIDPAAIEYLMGKTGMDIHQMLNYFNKQSGMLGISGTSSDFRDLTANAKQGDKRSQLALNMFCYHVKKLIGSYAAAMGGLDVIVFTAGVGENTDCVRRDSLSGLEFLGVELNQQKNMLHEKGIVDLSAKKSKVKILIVPTNEELVIARETLELIS